MTSVDKGIPIPQHQNKDMVTITMPMQNYGRQGASILPNYVHGMHSQPFFCLTCQKEHYSRVHYKCTKESWAKAIFCGACIAGLVFLGIIFIPITWFQTAIHTCPECGKEVGRTTP